MPCSLKIFLDAFAFLYVKPNSKEICEEISFPSFFRKMLMSAFLLRFKANISKKCVATPGFVDSNSPCKDLLFPHGPNPAQKSLYLVGTVLKNITSTTTVYVKLYELKYSFGYIIVFAFKYKIEYK